MSRRNAAANNIRGPTSALTEFLRANNITPTTVARRSAAVTQANQDLEQEEQPAEEPQPSPRRTRRRNSGYESDELDDPPTPAKKQKTSKAAPTKKAPAKGKGKKSKKDEGDEEEEEDPYNALSRSLWSNQGASSSKPPVGSFDTCAECEKQFTVTKYTMAAKPGPGYLCHSCAKASGADPFKKPAVPRKRQPARKPVAQFQEVILPTLSSLCIQIISRHLGDIDAFGDIGALNMDAISKAISKNRSLSSENVHLFYGAENSTLTLYDATKLNPTAFITLGHLNPNLTILRLDFCGLISDAVFESWCSSLPKLTSLKLLGPFLVRPAAWINFFKSHPRLECFEIVQSARFDLDCLNTLIATSGETLHTLGLQEVGQMSDEFLQSISQLSNLVSLNISDPPTPCSDEALIDMLGVVGPSLTRLNLSGHQAVSDDVLLKGLQPNTKVLSSLGLRGLVELSNEGVAKFFDGWSNSGLVSLDISRMSTLNKEALSAILVHSGSSLEELNINGWKDLDNEALGEIAEQAGNLRAIDLGFCRGVDDFTLKSLIEKNSGALREIKTWGCNHVEGKWESLGGKKHPDLKIHGLESHSVL